MTKASIALTELAEKGADVDLVREMLQFVAQRLMDADVEGLCGAMCGERGRTRSPKKKPKQTDAKANLPASYFFNISNETGSPGDCDVP